MRANDNSHAGSERFWNVVFAIAAVLLLALLVPIALLSTFNFVNGDDVGLLNLVLDRGWIETTKWFATYSMVRPVFIGLYSGLADLTFSLGLTPLDWIRIVVFVDYLLPIAAATWLVRVVLPRMPFALALAFAVAMILTTLLASLTLSAPVFSNVLLAWVVSNYLPGFAFYCALLASFFLFVSKLELRKWISILLLLAFVLYAGTHEVNVVGGLVFVGAAGLVSLRWARRSSPIDGGSRVSRMIRVRPEMHSRLVYLTGIVMVLIAGAFVYLHLTVHAFDNRAGYTTKATPVEAMARAAADLVNLVPNTYLVSSPLFGILFLLAVVVSRRYGLARFMKGANRNFLLVPIPVFFVVSFVTIVGSYMQTGSAIPRLLNYTGLHLVIAVFCLGIYVGTSGVVQRRRLLGARVLAGVGFLAVAGLVAADPVYRVAFSSATGPGLKLAEGYEKRDDLLKMGRDKVVRYPLVFMMLSSGTGTPIPYAPVIGWPPSGPGADSYRSGLAKLYGVRDIEFIDCAKDPSLRECFYVQVP
ncbi:MAG: hypothetical protein ABJ215_00620 [Alphaproteobacteria bacterium]